MVGKVRLVWSLNTASCIEDHHPLCWDLSGSLLRCKGALLRPRFSQCVSATIASNITWIKLVLDVRSSTPAIAMAPGMLQIAREKGELQIVSMNEIGYLHFEPNSDMCLGTKDLNSCTAIAIISKDAAILGHFSPRPASANENIAAGDAYIELKLQELRTLLGQHLSEFTQTPASAGLVAYAVYEGATALQSQRDLIESQLKAWKMLFTFIPYQVFGEHEPRGPAKGTVLIVPGDNGPTVYVEDKPMLSMKALASSSTESSAADPSMAAFG